MLLLAWRLLRPGLLPLWAGLPLGLFDDLYSGQPFGSGVLLFSLTLIAIELIEIRFPWRNFWLDWLTASAMLIVYLGAAAVLSGAPLTVVQLTVILPQLLLSVVLFPIVARLVAHLDRLRLMRVWRVG
jgi:rod shape-determining protein MreD